MKKVAIGAVVACLMLLHMDYVHEKEQQRFNAAVKGQAENLMAGGMPRHEAEIVAYRIWSGMREKHPMNFR